MIITQMNSDDINAVAHIHSMQFSRQLDSIKWVSCNFAAFPRIMLFVARDEMGCVVGYIQWIQKSGFRKEAVFELEQIAVLEEYQGKGVGTKLIKESVQFIKNYLAGNNAILKSVLISTRADNSARRLYEKILDAEEISVIENLYSDNEVLLLARYANG